MHNRQVKLPDGTLVPTMGQGTWMMGENPVHEKEEVAALKQGIDLGLTLIDTAEMYASGGSEKIISKAIAGIREQIFLVSKVYPHNAGANLERSCEASLKRLGTDCLDLYLLHWRGSVPFSETIAGMEKLIAAGKIRRWGVSNLDVDDMAELSRCRGAEGCMVNQVLYHLGSRGIEYDLLPWQRQQRMPIMAYSPLAQAGSLRSGLVNHANIQAVAKRHSASAFQVLLAWSMRDADVITIPKAATAEHVIANAKAADIQLSSEDLDLLDATFPPPKSKQPLDIV